VFDLGQDGRLRFHTRLLDETTMEQAKMAARCCPMQAVVMRGDLDG